MRNLDRDGAGWLETAELSTYSLVIPAPGVPANMNMFAGWIRRE